MPSCGALLATSNAGSSAATSAVADSGAERFDQRERRHVDELTATTK